MRRDAVIIYEKAKALYDAKEYQSALKKLLPILKTNDMELPYMKEALYLRALTFFRQAEALKGRMLVDAAKNSFKIDPKQKAMYFGLLQYSSRELRLVLEKYPDDEITPKALYTLAQVCEAKGKDHLSLAIWLYECIVLKYHDAEEKALAVKRLKEIKAHHGNKK